MFNKRLTLKGTFKNWMFLLSSKKIGIEKCKKRVHLNLTDQETRKLIFEK